MYSRVYNMCMYHIDLILTQFMALTKENRCELVQYITGEWGQHTIYDVNIRLNSISAKGMCLLSFHRLYKCAHLSQYRPKTRWDSM